MRSSYVHGYREEEGRRLADQAVTLEDLLHHDTSYPVGSTVLEAGCGVGAQTLPLIRNSPGAQFTCVDIAPPSLAEAEERVRAVGLPLPSFRHGDLRCLPFAEANFDHIYVCFVLEHLVDPPAVLAELRRVLRPGGSMTVIEGDHGSTLFHPDDRAARGAIRCQVELQRAAGGDAEIGRRLYPLLAAAGFRGVSVSPRLVYADATRPELVDGFIRRTFTAMVKGVRDAALRACLTDPAAFDAGVAALDRTTGPDGVFCYTFFKAVGFK